MKNPFEANGFAGRERENKLDRERDTYLIEQSMLAVR